MLEPSLTTTAPMFSLEVRERSAAERVARNAAARLGHRRLTMRRRLGTRVPRARLGDQSEDLTEELCAPIRRRGVLAAPRPLDAGRDRGGERVGGEAVVDRVLGAEHPALEADIGTARLAAIAAEAVVGDPVGGGLEVHGLRRRRERPWLFEDEYAERGVAPDRVVLDQVGGVARQHQ